LLERVLKHFELVTTLLTLIFKLTTLEQRPYVLLWPVRPDGVEFFVHVSQKYDLISFLDFINNI